MVTRSTKSRDCIVHADKELICLERCNNSSVGYHECREDKNEKENKFNKRSMKYGEIQRFQTANTN